MKNNLLLNKSGNLQVFDVESLENLTNVIQKDYKNLIRHVNLPKMEIERVQNLWNIPSKQNKTLLCTGGVKEQ